MWERWQTSFWRTAGNEVKDEYYIICLSLFLCSSPVFVLSDSKESAVDAFAGGERPLFPDGRKALADCLSGGVCNGSVHRGVVHRKDERTCETKEGSFFCCPFLPCPVDCVKIL